MINFPILYALVGRNNPVSFLTGTFPHTLLPTSRAELTGTAGIAYQEVRFYHKVIRRIVFLESFVHTFAYIGYVSLLPLRSSSRR